MSYLEEEYLRRASYLLRNFKSKGNHTFNFSCPVCGDSAKKKSKARGYAYDKEGSLLVKCYNCGYGTVFPNFLKEIDPTLHEEFVLERFKERTGRDMKQELEFHIPETKKYVPDIFSGLPSLSKLNPEHESRVYSDSRRLPIQTFEFYYAEKFIEWTLGHSDKFKEWKGADHSRVVLPFRARDGHIIGYTARALKGEEPKYIRMFVDANEKEKFFGIDRLDENKQVYVLEGEIDSLFIPNAIAVSNGKLDCYLNKDAIYIPDADKRNQHIVKGIGELLDSGLKVCLLPDGLPGKDINELVVAGYTLDKILSIINENVYQGLTGKLKFNKWRIG